MDMLTTPQFGQNKRTTESPSLSHQSQHSSPITFSSGSEKAIQRMANQQARLGQTLMMRNNQRALGKSYEVTFLNKVVQISLWKQDSSCFGKISRTEKEEPNKGNSQQIMRVINLAVRHFKIKLDFIESVHLVNIEQSQIIWKDEDLRSGQSYYLCFARSGFKISQNSIASVRHQDIALLDLEYFGRHGREFRILDCTEYDDGRVQDLYINQSRGNFYGFYCPFLHCAKQFRKSCDLVLHFNIETGNKPYVCEKCGSQFRRSSAHRRHVATCISESEKCSANLLEQLKPSELEREVKAQHQAKQQHSTALPQVSSIPTPLYEMLGNVINQIFTNQARLHERLLAPQTSEERYAELQIDMCRQIIKTAFFLRKLKVLLN